MVSGALAAAAAARRRHFRTPGFDGESLKVRGAFGATADSCFRPVTVQTYASVAAVADDVALA